MFSAEHAALNWFYEQLQFQQPTKLYSLIKYIREYGTDELYAHHWLNSENQDHARLIVVPAAPLMAIQHKVKDFLVANFKRKPCSYGFMGGSCEEAACAHKANRSFLKFDVRNAFFQVGHLRVVESLSYAKLPFVRNRGVISKWVAGFVSDICTVRSWPEVSSRYGCSTFLPQGAPTSPVLFDIACGRLDKELLKIANRVGGTYTRYADNVVFSMPDRKFPPKLRRAILHEAMSLFPIHKVNEVGDGKPFHMLGLQIANNQVHMTRAYKRKLRGALYHLDYAARHGTVDQRALDKARGLMSFAIWEDLPDEAMRAFLQNCKKNHI